MHFADSGSGNRKNSVRHECAQKLPGPPFPATGRLKPIGKKKMSVVVTAAVNQIINIDVKLQAAAFNVTFRWKALGSALREKGPPRGTFTAIKTGCNNSPRIGQF